MTAELHARNAAWERVLCAVARNAEPLILGEVVTVEDGDRDRPGVVRRLYGDGTVDVEVSGRYFRRVDRVHRGKISRP